MTAGGIIVKATLPRNFQKKSKNSKEILNKFYNFHIYLCIGAKSAKVCISDFCILQSKPFIRRFGVIIHFSNLQEGRDAFDCGMILM